MRSERALASAVRFPRVLNIADLRELARRRVPSVVFAYIDGGAEDEITLRENARAFSDIAFRPRQCMPVPACDLRTEVLGTTLEVPFMLAPVGFCRMFYPQGEMRAARAANAAGTAYILSTFSGMRLEDVRHGTGGPLWYQLYVPGGREVAEATIARARAAGYSALVVTIDTPVSGMRERDFRYGVKPLLGGRLWASLPYAWQFVTRPRWVLDYLADGAVRVFPNVELPGTGPMPCGDVSVLLERTLVTWEDLRWMRDAWQGPIVVKGIHTGDDARRAIDAGAAAVVVSNHGGRQLDGAPSSIAMLPKIADAVGNDIEVMFDGGIRSGQDLFRALALGAKSCLIGRAYIYGLGALGKPGVKTAIEIIRKELDITMALTGVTRIADIGRNVLATETVPAETHVLEMAERKQAGRVA